jgi:phage-related protein
MSYSESLDFSYAGENSTDYGIINVNYSTGLYEETFLPSRGIKEIQVSGRKKPYFQELEYSPLSLKLSFAIQSWTEDSIRSIARWLGSQEYYKPLYFSNNTNRIFYCLYNGNVDILHNGLKQGIINIEMRCDSPYSYSPVYTSQIYSSPSSITFTNNGDVSLYPEISIEKVGDGNLSIVNQTNGNQEFKFTSLLNNEKLYIDCESEYIETDLSNTYRYSNFNDKYLELVRGNNVLNITGGCNLRFRYQFKTLQG